MVLRVGPYRFFFYEVIAMSRHMFMLSMTIKSQSSGLTRFGYKGVVDFPGQKLAGFRNW